MENTSKKAIDLVDQSTAQVEKTLGRLDALKLVYGFDNGTGKRKKSKTKCQQKKKPLSQRDRSFFLTGVVVLPGYSLHQVSRYKFILTGPIPSLIDLKRNTRQTIERDSKIGKRFAL